MKMILNFTNNAGHNGYRAKINARVVGVVTDAADINTLIMNVINMGSLTKQLKKGKDVKAATATMIWRAVRAIIEAQGLAVDGILMPDDVPFFVSRKLERKLQKRGMKLYTVSDLR